MSRSSLRMLVSLLAALVLAGCAALRGPKVHVDSEFDRRASFETLHSFDFLVIAEAAPRDERIDAKLLNARIQRAAAEALEQRGFVRNVDGAPDFLIVPHVMLDSRFDIDRYIDLDLYGYRTWVQPMRTRSVIRDYDQGVLILDIVDAGTKRMIWRGYGETRVDLDDAEARRRADLIRAVVAEMLESFPPR